VTIETCPQCGTQSLATTPGASCADKGHARKDCRQPGCDYQERAGAPVRSRKPKDVATEQLLEEDYDSLGEGARRDMLGDYWGKNLPLSS
jgi:hypothetical protein